MSERQIVEIELDEKNLIYEGYLHLETGRRCPSCGGIVRSPATACILCCIPFEECEELERPMLNKPTHFSICSICKERLNECVC